MTIISHIVHAILLYKHAILTFLVLDRAVRFPEKNNLPFLSEGLIFTFILNGYVLVFVLNDAIITIFQYNLTGNMVFDYVEIHAKHIRLNEF